MLPPNYDWLKYKLKYTAKNIVSHVFTQAFAHTGYCFSIWSNTHFTTCSSIWYWLLHNSKGLLTFAFKKDSRIYITEVNHHCQTGRNHLTSHTGRNPLTTVGCNRPLSLLRPFFPRNQGCRKLGDAKLIWYQSTIFHH